LWYSSSCLAGTWTKKASQASRRTLVMDAG
jgi:hypothetical protein